MSGSVILFMWPFLTMWCEYKIDIAVTVGVEELQRLASIKALGGVEGVGLPDTVEQGEESGLEGILEHAFNRIEVIF